jgi:hypothetical protein
MSNKSFRCLTLAALILLGLLGQTAQAADKAQDTPLDLKPLAKIDERLFLVHSLGKLYREWPATASDAWLVDKYLHIKRLKAHIEQERLGDDIVRLYADAVKCFEAYQEYLITIGAVQRETLVRIQRERANLFERGVRRVVQKTAQDLKGGVKFDKAFPKRAGETLVAALIVDIFSQAQRNEEKRRSLERARLNYNNRFTTLYTRTQVAVLRLARKLGWKDGEAGFDSFTSNQMAELMRRRPRDPFLIVQNSDLWLRQGNAEQLIAAARSSVLAAQKVLRPGSTTATALSSCSVPECSPPRQPRSRARTTAVLRSLMPPTLSGTGGLAATTATRIQPARRGCTSAGPSLWLGDIVKPSRSPLP